MKKEIFTLIFLGYGIAIVYWNFSKDFKNDGSIKKNSIEFARGMKYRNPKIIINWLYVYSLSFVLVLNKERF